MKRYISTFTTLLTLLPTTFCPAFTPVVLKQGSDNITYNTDMNVLSMEVFIAGCYWGVDGSVSSEWLVCFD